MDLVSLKLTAALATSTTVILTVFGVPLAYWLARTRWSGKFLIESIVALPLILPPTVLGFYLLLATGPQSTVGRLYESATGSRLPFTFTGIALGSVLYNLPFAVRPFQAAFSSMNFRLIEASWCLGESRWRTFWRLTVPLCWPGLLAGMVLTFAHTVGEFGVVLMIGGNIPGITRTLSVCIYDDVQALNYVSASRTAIVLVLFSLSVLCLTHILSHRKWPK